LSDEAARQRTKTRFFIEGWLRGSVRVRSFRRLGWYLWGDENLRNKANMRDIAHCEVDAENYVNLLVATIHQSLNPASDQVMEAVKELYECINVLAQDIDDTDHFAHQ